MLVPSELECPLSLALSPILLAGKWYLVLAFSFAGKQNGGEGTYYSATSDFANGSVPHSICVKQRGLYTRATSLLPDADNYRHLLPHNLHYSRPPSGRYLPNVQKCPSTSRAWYSREPKSVSVGGLVISAPADSACWKCASRSSTYT